MKKPIKFLISTAIVANFLLFSVASAQTTTSTQKLSGGLLRITSVPHLVSFTELNVSSAEQSNSVTFTSDMAFEDMRGLVNPQAWNISVTATNWRNKNDPLATSFSYTNFSIKPSDDEVVTNVVNSDDCNGNIYIPGVAQGYRLFTNGGNPDLSAPVTLISAYAQTYTDQCTTTPQLNLTIPAATQAGAWTSTLTFTIV